MFQNLMLCTPCFPLIHRNQEVLTTPERQTYELFSSPNKRRDILKKTAYLIYYRAHNL